MTQTEEELARQAYEAYGKVTDFKNYQGLPMPKWEDLTPKIREAWEAASVCIYAIAFNDAKEMTIPHLKKAGL